MASKPEVCHGIVSPRSIWLTGTRGGIARKLLRGAAAERACQQTASLAGRPRKSRVTLWL